MVQVKEVWPLCSLLAVKEAWLWPSDSAGIRTQNLPLKHSDVLTLPEVTTLSPFVHLLLYIDCCILYISCHENNATQIAEWVICNDLDRCFEHYRGPSFGQSENTTSACWLCWWRCVCTHSTLIMLWRRWGECFQNTFKVLLTHLKKLLKNYLHISW